MYFPKEILAYIKDGRCERNEAGMSGSQVYIFEKYVLKIQPYIEEADNEYAMSKWLSGSCPVPRVFAYVKENGMAYTLAEKAPGKMLCDESFMQDPRKLTERIAEGLQMLWDVDISACPCRFSRLTERLKTARENVEKGEVDIENAEPETFGPKGFANPPALLEWLERNRPEEDLVLSHGDFCLPNILSDGEKITAFIDNGKMGPADRWQDLAIVRRSLRHNFSGKYANGIPYEGYDDGRLLDILGITADEEKDRYYLLLDELF